MAVRLGFIFILEMFYLLSDTKFHDSQVKSQNFLNSAFTSSLSEQKKGLDETAVTLRFWLVHAVGAVLVALVML